jgi:hypothetical protein
MLVKVAFLIVACRVATALRDIIVRSTGQWTG